MKKITINDIAARSGVSKSTVSRAINNNGYVSEDKRRRIQEAIAETAYQPSAAAQSMSTQHSNNVDVVLPRTSSGFFGRVLDGIERACEESGHTVQIFLTDDDPQKELLILQRLKGQKPKGILIIPSAGYLDTAGWQALNRALLELDVPVVTIDRGARKSDWDGVFFDNYSGAYMIAEVVIQRGFNRIGAMISDTSLRLGYDRMSGFRQAVEDYNCSFQPEWFLQDSKFMGADQIFESTLRLLEKESLPEACLFSNCDMASGFVKALVRRGYRPDQVFIACFDPVPVLDVLSIPYYYIEHDDVQIGSIAARMLVDHFESDIESRREYVVPSRLIGSRIEV